MKNACRTSTLMILLSLVAAGIVFAQSDLGTISGFIKDQSGASVPNAKVTIKNQTGILFHHQHPARLLYHERRGPRFSEV